MKQIHFHPETHPRIILILDWIKMMGEEEAVCEDTGQGFSKTDNRHLATDSQSPKNFEKDKYTDINKFW